MHWVLGVFDDTVQYRTSIMVTLPSPTRNLEVLTAPIYMSQVGFKKNTYLAILCDLFGMVSLRDPFKGESWPPTRGWKAHFESPGSQTKTPPTTQNRWKKRSTEDVPSWRGTQLPSLRNLRTWKPRIPNQIRVGIIALLQVTNFPFIYI